MNKLFGFLVGLFALNLVSAQQYNYPAGFCGGMMTGSYGYGYMAFGWVFMALILIALVLLIIWLAKQISSGSKRRR